MDWDRIIELYDLLNRAIAITERDGPQHGLAVLEAIVGIRYGAVPSLARRSGRQPATA
jgi:predicted RNA polymerase sigma factor